MAWAVENAAIGPANGASGASTTITLNTNTTIGSGSWIEVEVASFSGNTVSSVADDGPGLTWTSVAQFANGSTRIAKFRAYAPSGMSSGTSITATYSASTSFRGIGGTSWTGGASDSVIASTSSASGSTAAWSVSPAALNAGDLVTGGGNLNNTAGGHTEDANSTEAWELSVPASPASYTLVYRLAAGAGSSTVGGTWSGANTWIAAGAAYTETAPPGPLVQTTAESTTATAGTSHTINLPSGIQADDLLILCLDKGSTAATVDAHADWTELLDENQANGLYIAYRWADGSEGATTTLTTSASTRTATIAFRISNAQDPATQPPEIGSTASGTSATPDPPTVTPTGGAKDYLWIAFYGAAGEEADDDTWSDTPPTGYAPTPPLQKAAGTAGTNLGGLIAAAYKSANASSDNPGTFAKDVSAAWRAQTIVIHPAAGGQTISVGQAVETDTAHPVGKAKAKAIGQALETSTAQPISVRKTRAIAQASETDTATAISRAKAKALAQASETDTATTITRQKARVLGQAAEVDTAQPIAASDAITVTVNQATETDTAQPIGQAKAKAIGQASESDTATALGRLKTRLLGQATETDTAQPVAKRKARTLGQALETNIAQAVTVIGGLIVATLLKLRVRDHRALSSALRDHRALASDLHDHPADSSDHSDH